MSEERDEAARTSTTTLAKINLYASTVWMALIARSLWYPRILAFVPGVLGSETSHLVLFLQLLNLRQILDNHPSLLLHDALGRIALASNAVCLAIFAHNLAQGLFHVPTQFATALQLAKIPPLHTMDRSLSANLLHLASLLPLYAVSRRFVRVDVQRDVQYADMSILHTTLLDRWKRSPPVMRNANALVLRGRISKWLTLDVHAAPGFQGKRPVLLYIHGGAWVLGDKSLASLALINRLASRGIVVATVNYRLSPEVSFPTHIVDCKRALIFVKKHCEVWGGDANRVFVAGESAGGHLSALMGCTGNYPPFQPPECPLEDTSLAGALPIYGVYDWLDSDGHLREVAQEYLGVRIGIRPLVSLVVVQDLYKDETKHQWEEASPTFHLRRMVRECNVDPKLPPYFISHGTLDALTSLEDSRKFFTEIQKLRKRFPLPDGSENYGDAHVTVDGGVHGFGYLPSPRSHIMADAFCDFIFHHFHQLAPVRV